jgi:hypothetical protein
MDDHSYQPDQAPPQEWIDALARADADVAAGRTVEWSAVRARLLARADEMEAEKARRRA